MRYVIIGTGGAGVSAAEAIREYDQESEIIMISNEDTPPYSACLLLYYLLNENKRDVVFWKGKDFYERMNITPVLGKEVNEIQPKDKNIIVDNESITYDKLLIAAGGKVDFPSIKGINKHGIFTFKTLSDTDNIHNWLKTQKVQNAVILGGGFIGLDAAEGLKKHNVNVTVVEALNRVLPHMLDREMGDLVNEILQHNDVNVRLESKMTKILGDTRVKTIKLSDKTILDTDMVIIATGVKPNLNIVKNSGITINSGVIVNDYLETNIPNIYAAGDIVESIGITTGIKEPILLWSNALIQGTTAGYNMVGKKIKYSGSSNQTLIKLFGIPIISDGLFEGEEIKSFRENVFKKMYFRDSTIIGYILVNTMQNAGVYHSLMVTKRDISEYKNLLLKNKFNIGMIETKAAMLQEIY